MRRNFLLGIVGSAAGAFGVRAVRPLTVTLPREQGPPTGIADRCDLNANKLEEQDGFTSTESLALRSIAALARRVQELEAKLK